MPKKSHEENLATVCCVCGRKGRQFRNVTENLAQKVRLLQPSYDRHGGLHPTAICSSCRKACTEMEKNPKQTRNKVPGLLDYSALNPPEQTETAAAVSVKLKELVRFSVCLVQSQSALSRTNDSPLI